MEMRRIVSGALIGLGLVAVGYTALGRQNDTIRNDNGAIVAAGNMAMSHIQLGDCLNGVTPGAVESMQGVPCTTPHHVEVYYAFDLPDGDYPGKASLTESAGSRCFNAFEPFIGHELETSIFDVSYLYPSAESWDELRDREILCMINNYDMTEKTGSAENSGI